MNNRAMNNRRNSTWNPVPWPLGTPKPMTKIHPVNRDTIESSVKMLCRHASVYIYPCADNRVVIQIHGTSFSMHINNVTARNIAKLYRRYCRLFHWNY